MFVELMKKLDLQTHSWNGACSHVGNLLYTWSGLPIPLHPIIPLGTLLVDRWMTVTGSVENPPQDITFAHFHLEAGKVKLSSLSQAFL